MTIINDRLKLNSVDSICALLSDCLPEKILEAKIYDNLVTYLLILKDHNNWLVEYLKLELMLLTEMGYGLGLDACALTGEKNGLYYISPKTGMAVTRQAGEKYGDKLLKLPSFFAGTENIEADDILNAYNLNSHFLYKRLYHPLSKDLPLSRSRLFGMIFK
jgi:DNA repair protein RecO (recombination protein O)